MLCFKVFLRLFLDFMQMCSNRSWAAFLRRFCHGPLRFTLHLKAHRQQVVQAQSLASGRLGSAKYEFVPVLLS